MEPLMIVGFDYLLLLAVALLQWNMACSRVLRCLGNRFSPKAKVFFFSSILFPKFIFSCRLVKLSVIYRLDLAVVRLFAEKPIKNDLIHAGLKV